MAEQQGNDLTSQIMDGTFNDLEDIFQTQKEQKTADLQTDDYYKEVPLLS
jgi:hypothetical protein